MDVPDIHIVQFTMLIPAVLIILFLSFLEKRKVGRNICGGRPALITPIPSIDGFENRTAYAMAFGVSLITILRIVVSKNSFKMDEIIWMKTFYLWFRAFIVCIITLPFCAAISTRYRAAGAIINIMYCAVWLIMEVLFILKDMPQPYGLDEQSYKLAKVIFVVGCLTMVPYFIYQLLLIFYCCYILYRCFRCWSFVSQKIPGVVRQHQVEHVNWVLRKNKDKVYIASLTDPLGTFVSQMNKSRKLRLITNLPFFKYPAKIYICVIFQLTVIYMMTVGSVLFYAIIENEKQKGSQLKDWKDLISTFLNLLNVLNISEGALIAAFVCTSINSLWNILMLCRNYRYHMLKLYQGDKDFIADWESTPQYTVSSSMHSIGSIMLFTLAGWSLCFSALFIFIFFASLCIYILIEANQLDKFLINTGAVLCFLATTLVLTVILTLISKKFLLQKKIDPSEKNPPLNLDNRKLYEIINYFYLYVSMARSIIFCCWRLALTTTFGMLSLGRLDETIFSKDKQRFDIVHGIYIAMLKVDHAHNNPSMRLFAHLLWSEILVSRLRNSGGSQTEMARLRETLNHRLTRKRSDWRHAHVSDVYFVSQNVDTKSKLARTRWFLAYTLIRNPQLASLRRNGTLDYSEPGTDGINIQVTDTSPLFDYSSSISRIV